VFFILVVCLLHHYPQVSLWDPFAYPPHIDEAVQPLAKHHLIVYVRRLLNEEIEVTAADQSEPTSKSSCFFFNSYAIFLDIPFILSGFMF